MLSRHRHMLNIAVPQVLGNLLHTLVVYTDFLMVSQLSKEAIVAVGIGMQIWGLFYASMSLIYTGQNTLMSRFIGANEYKRASILLSTLLIFVVVLSLPVTIFWKSFGLYLFELFEANQVVMHLGKTYLSMIFTAILLAYVNSIFFISFITHGDSKTPMYIAVFVVFLNIVLDYTLIFGHFGFEKRGVEGAAIATVLTMLFESIVYIFLYLSKKTSFQVMNRFSIQLTRRVFKIGFPSLVDRMLGSMAMLIFTTILLALDTSICAGFQLGFRIEGLAFMPGFGFAMAASVLMGQGLGAKNPDESYANVLLALKYGVVFMFSVSMLFIFIPEFLIGFFTQEEGVIYEASNYLMVVGLVQIPLAVGFILNGALKGAGDTKRVFKINVLSTWILRIVPGVISVYGFGSIYGVYFGLLVDPIVKSLIYWTVFKKGEWRRLKV